eukprot:8417959-Pyramimonas_sp.AAC.1
MFSCPALLNAAEPTLLGPSPAVPVSLGLKLRCFPPASPPRAKWESCSRRVLEVRAQARGAAASSHQRISMWWPSRFRPSTAILGAG